MMAWRDDTLDLGHFGINTNIIAEAKDDGGDLLDNFIAGEPESFQDELLKGIGFLQERIQRSEHNPDSIALVRSHSAVTKSYCKISVPVHIPVVCNT